jgi:hypothetical protein
MILFLTFLLHQENRIAGIFLVVAFILTFWKRRSLFWFAAGFYCAGSLVNIGAKVCLWLVSVWFAYGLSESGDVNTALLAALVLPILAGVYAMAGVILIWPWISQKYALWCGKVLHLIILPILVSIIFIGSFFTPGRSQTWLDLQWLVYGPLWFRIRESWVTKKGV